MAEGDPRRRRHAAAADGTRRPTESRQARRTVDEDRCRTVVTLPDQTARDRRQPRLGPPLRPRTAPHRYRPRRDVCGPQHRGHPPVLVQPDRYERELAATYFGHLSPTPARYQRKAFVPTTE